MSLACRLAVSAISGLITIGAFVAPAVAAGSGTWSTTGNLHASHDGHTATVLPSGEVLVAGGEGQNGVVAATELYSAASRSWTVAGSLAVARAAHDALLFGSGKVLVAGGCLGTCVGGNTPTAEIFDPSKGRWSMTGSMATARVYFGMALLPNGKVLVVGGCTGQNANGCTGVTAAAEIYDPATGRWSATDSLHAARGAFSTTTLSNGQILVAGGINAAGNPINSAEIYDPTRSYWSVIGAMKVARDEHTATLLPNGKVLVAGGENQSGVTTNQAEVYSPSTRAWSLTGNMNVSRLEHTSVLLGNGTVLVSGGNNVTNNATTVVSSTEIYNPGTGRWSATGNMTSPRVGHSSTLLQSGQVLNAAGNNGNNELVTAELYQP